MKYNVKKESLLTAEQQAKIIENKDLGPVQLAKAVEAPYARVYYFMRTNGYLSRGYKPPVDKAPSKLIDGVEYFNPSQYTNWLLGNAK